VKPKAKGSTGIRACGNPQYKCGVLIGTPRLFEQQVSKECTTFLKALKSEQP